MLATIIGQGVTFDIALLYFVVKRVSDRFSEYKENPENTGFSGSVALFRYSLELSL